MSQTKFRKTIDYQRASLSRKHQRENPISIPLRECLHNAVEYGADDIFIFNFTKNRERYIAVAHNGKPFGSISDIENSMQFNLTGGNGVQGSGGKTAMYVFMENKSNVEYLIHTKIPNDKAHTYSLITNKHTKSELITVDKSSMWNSSLKNILNSGSTDEFRKDLYDNYNVIYVYRYDNSNTKRESITNHKYMNKLMGISNQIQKKVSDGELTITYSSENNVSEINTIKSEHRVYIKDVSMLDDYMIKEFKFDVNNIKFEDEEKNIDINFEAEITLKVFPNFIWENKNGRDGFLSRYNISKNKKPHYSKMSMTDINDYNSNGITLYHDVNLGSANATRANEEPFYVSSQFSSWHSFEVLGAKRPTVSSKWSANKDKIKEYLGNSMKFLSKEDYDNINTWIPNVNIEIRLKKINDIDEIGSIDNFFYSMDNGLVRKILKEVLAKGQEDNCDTLKEYNNYITEFINENEELDLLAYNDSYTNKSIPKIRTEIEPHSIEKINSGIIKNVKTKDIYLKSIPVGLQDPIEVKFYDEYNKVITQERLMPNKPGLIISKHPTKDDVYRVETDNYHRIEYDNGVPNKIYHSKKEHKNIANYYPVKLNKVSFGDKTYRLDFTIDVPVNTTNNTSDRSKDNGKKSKSVKKPDSDIYFPEPNKPDLLVMWDSVNRKAKLNSANPKIRSFAKNTSAQAQKFASVYKQINDYGMNIFVNRYFDEKFKLTMGGNENFFETYGEGDNCLFNIKVDTFLDVSEVVKKLKESHIKHMKGKETPTEESEASNKENYKSKKAKLV